MRGDFTITINSILSGISPSQYFSTEDGYETGVGIDPDFPTDDTSVRPSGLIRPTAMAKFSAGVVNSPPLWIETNPKDTNVYTYLVNGRLVSYNSSLASETNIGVPTSGAGNGLKYYDNYIWGATPTDLFRYGPLSASPTIINGTWTSSTAFTGTAGGVNLTALTNTVYPTIRGVVMPNHVMHRHTDDKLYFCDVHANGYGILNYIKTSRTSVDGDTNSGSTYNALDFDSGEYPTTIETYGTDLAVALIEGVSIVIRQKNAKLAFWDTTSSSFQKKTDVEFPDPLITALKNVNGILYVWSGSATGGCRLSRFVGGYTLEQVWYNPDVFPPLQGAVDHLMNKVYFGTGITYPSTYASVFALGSVAGLSSGVHNVLSTTATGTTPYATSLKFVQNSALPLLAPIVGWRDGTTSGAIDKLSTTYGTPANLWRSQLYKVSRLFQINEIEFQIPSALATNMTYTLKILSDDFDTTTTIATINSTNYPNSEKTLKIPCGGLLLRNNFCLQIEMSGTVLSVVSFPITIKCQKLDG